MADLKGSFLFCFKLIMSVLQSLSEINSVFSSSKNIKPAIASARILLSLGMCRFKREIVCFASSVKPKIFPSTVKVISVSHR